MAISYWDRIKAYAWLVKGDGCTKAPDLYWRSCCDEHDVHYRLGHRIDGTPISKKEADDRFLACMKENAQTWFGRYILSYVYYTAVRVFGKGYWDEHPGRNDRET